MADKEKDSKKKSGNEANWISSMFGGMLGGASEGIKKRNDKNRQALEEADRSRPSQSKKWVE